MFLDYENLLSRLLHTYKSYYISETHLALHMAAVKERGSLLYQQNQFRGQLNFQGQEADCKAYVNPI